MTSRKLRTVIAVFAAAVTVSVASPALTPDAHAAKKATATVTGKPKLDDYCKGVADLINDAVAQGEAHAYAGRNDEARAWQALADELEKRATENGCTFVWARKFDPGSVVDGPIVTGGGANQN